jgi:trimethylamine:corrinoid methyltransferase-like protein
MNVHSALHMNLDDEGCRLVVEGALRLLSEDGVECTSELGRDFIGSKEGTRIEGERVVFDREFLDDYLERVRSQAQEEPPDGPFRLRAPWTSLNIADVRAGEIRPAGEEDLARAVRLYEAMGIENGMAPVTVGTAPPENRELLNTLVCLENSRSFGGPTELPDDDRLKVFLDMFAVAGRELRMTALFIISPLRYESRIVEFCVNSREDERFRIGYAAGGMACTGSTAPLVFPGTFCLTLAEGLSASLFTYFCIGERRPFSLRADPFDFRFGNYLVGSSEYTLLDCVSRRLYLYLYGRQNPHGKLLTMARWPDAQAVHDHATAAFVQALQGVRSFGNSGQICHDEVFSPEIVVIDRDIVASTERFMKGLDWDAGEDGLAESLSVIRDGLQTGHFLDHDTTVARCRDFLFAGELFRGMNLGQWRQSGGKMLMDEVSALVDEFVASNDFRRPDDDVRELRRIYESAVKT